MKNEAKNLFYRVLHIVMKQLLFSLLIIFGFLSSSAFAQQLRATSFEITERKTLNYGGHEVGKLFVTVNDEKRKIVDEALKAWIINNGKEVVFSQADGSRGFEGTGNSLSIYEVQTGKIRQILADHFVIDGITETELSNGKRALLIRSDLHEGNEKVVAVVDPKRGEVFVKSPAGLFALKGDFMALNLDNDESEEPEVENNESAFDLPQKKKPLKLKKYDLKKLLKKKVIYNKTNEELQADFEKK